MGKIVDSNNKRAEYYLDANSDGYAILAHCLDDYSGEGDCCLRVTDNGMNSGDDYWDSYDYDAVCVGKEVKERAMQMYHEAGGEHATQEGIEKVMTYLRGQYEHHCRLKEVLSGMDECQWGEPEYYLGAMYDGGYMIVRHYANFPQGQGVACLEICPEWLTDGNNCPVGYDDAFVKMERETCWRAVQPYRDAATELARISGEPIPADRDIRVGDHLKYKHRFLCVVAVSPNECTTKDFFVCNNAIFKEDDEMLCAENPDLLKKEGMLITEEQYNKGRMVAKDAHEQILKRFKEEYERHR